MELDVIVLGLGSMGAGVWTCVMPTSVFLGWITSQKKSGWLKNRWLATAV